MTEHGRGKISSLKLRLADDLQSVYLTRALREIHPAILQTSLEQFAKVAVERKGDSRINVVRVVEILQERGVAHDNTEDRTA